MKSYKYFAYYIIIAGFCSLNNLIITSFVSAEDSITDEVAISIPIACSIFGTGMSSHTASVENGRYVTDIGETTMNVQCNDNNGFVIYATGFTNNTYGETYLASSLGPSSNIPTGTATSGTTSNWAVKLSVSGTSYIPTLHNNFGDYRTIPNQYTKAASLSSATDIGGSAIGSTLKSTYAAFISNSQLAGTYIGKVKYTIVHPSTNTPDNLKIAQNVANWASFMNVGDTANMLDIRDNKIYPVVKLSDGNIWMTQNLDLDLDSNKTYTSNDTDLPSGTTWTPLRSTYQVATTIWCASGNTSHGECYRNYTPESIDLGNRFWVDSITQYTCGNGYEACIIANTSNTGDQHHHLGNMYNTSAAYASNDISSFDDAYQENPSSVDRSICPAGWKLPDEYDYDSAVNSISSVNSPFNSPLYFTPISALDGNSESIYYPTFGEAAILQTKYEEQPHRIKITASGTIDEYGGYIGYATTIRCIHAT